MGIRKKYVCACLLALLGLASMSFASSAYTGNVTWLEVWRNGNVAFMLSTPVSTCNGQFILNASDAGTKNQYALLLTAKNTGTPVKAISNSCAPADNYGSSYNTVDYLYPN